MSTINVQQQISENKRKLGVIGLLALPIVAAMAHQSYLLRTNTANTHYRGISSLVHPWFMGPSCENGIKIEKVG
jgi:hypothetical protein